MTVTPFTTPGQHDRNVAVAWTQWLLRDDDAPRSVLDAAMNGLAAGSVSGAGVDILYAMLRRAQLSTAQDAVYAWTRRGAAMGATFSIACYAARTCSTRFVSEVQPSNVVRSGSAELMSDPWDRPALTK
jgi:hypothetical protein